MKHIFISIFCLCYCVAAISQQTAEDSIVLKRIKAAAIYELPYSSNESFRSTYSSSLTGCKLLPNTSQYVYWDLGRTLKSWIPNPRPSGIFNYSVQMRFQSPDKQRNLLLILISIAEFGRYVLMNFDRENLSTLDTLEVKSVFSYWCNKEFSIDTAMNVVVRELEIIEPQLIKVTSEPQDIKARRIDRYYHIGDNGKFILDREQRYKPCIYSKEYIHSRKNGESLITGDEEPE